MANFQLPKVIREMIVAVGQRGFASSDANVTVQSVFDQILLDKKDVHSSESQQVDKQFFTALVFVILQAAKSNCSAEELSLEISKWNWPAEVVTVITERYKTDVPSIRDMLSRIGWRPPEILDVNWSLEHLIKFQSSTCDSVAHPRYTITIPSQAVGSCDIESFQFQCSVDQLQDLVWKLREATQCVTKYSNSS